MYTYICEEAFLSYHPGNIAIAPNKLYKKRLEVVPVS